MSDTALSREFLFAAMDDYFAIEVPQEFGNEDYDQYALNLKETP